MNLPIRNASYWWVAPEHRAGAAGECFAADEAYALLGDIAPLHYTSVPVCFATEKIEIYHSDIGGKHVIVGGKELIGNAFKRLLLNDGFAESTKFFDYFVPAPDDCFKGQIVHWSDWCIYNESQADVIKIK